MDDLISRRAAIDVGWDLIIPVDGYHMYNQAINNYCAELINLPAAEPERKKGKWVNCYTDGFRNMCKCSECGAMIDIQEKFRSFFCYHCGADMRGEQDE